MIWFTSDTHFGHENVLKFTDRPWETIWQMNDAIVDNINGKVAVDDELYILGDFSFKMTAQDAYGLRNRETMTRTGPSRRSRAPSPWSRRSACSRSTGRRSS